MVKIIRPEKGISQNLVTSMKKYIHGVGRENQFLFALGVVVFGLTFTALTVDASSSSSYVYNQPPSCTISLKDVPMHVPLPAAPQGSGYPMLLSWSSGNATAASISPSIGAVPLEGSRVVYVRGERFSMAAYGPRGATTCQTTEYLLPSPHFANSLLAGPIMSLRAPTYSQHTNYPTLASTPVRQVNTYPQIHPLPVTQIQIQQPVQVQVQQPLYPIRPIQPRQVSLTQIPYTGVGDVALAMFMWLSVIMLALFGAVAIAQRGHFMEKIATRLRG